MVVDMNVYVETYGCSNNQAEGEMMAGLLQRSGFDTVQNIDLSDVVIINSCVVKEPTEQKIIHRIEELKQKGKKVVLAGCMPEVRDTTAVDGIVSTHHLKEIPKAVKEVTNGKSCEFIGKGKTDKLCLPRMKKNKFIGIVPIASGCLGNCSYCITKRIKGNLVSYPEEEIIKEIKHQINSGAKEIWLTAQDVGSYGFDKGSDIAELLEKIIDLEGNFKVRMGMMNPYCLKIFKNRKRLTKLFKSEKIYSFLHLPVQSGSDRILKDMNRKYESKDFEEIVEEFRKEIPDLNLWTDIIVGYPGENEEDFNETVKLLERTRPDFVNISRYGKRAGTKAANKKEVPTEIKKDRSRRISKLTKNLTEMKNQKFVGKNLDVLITRKGKKPGQFIGRTENYKPVLVESGEKLFGKIISVKLKSSGYYLIGKV